MNSYELGKKGMLIESEIRLLKTCTNTLPVKPIIANIGAGVGTSALAILEERPRAVIFSFDIKPVPEESQVVVLAGFHPGRVVRVLGKSFVTGMFFPRWFFNLVFVDGAHDNESVERDILVFTPLLKPGGIILFHDYMHPNLPDLTGIVDLSMVDYHRIDQARYLVAFRKP